MPLLKATEIFSKEGIGREPIREAPNKKNSIGVSRFRVKFLKMPLFPFLKMLSVNLHCLRVMLC